jgi:hypothetical protein
MKLGHMLTNKWHVNVVIYGLKMRRDSTFSESYTALEL